MRLEGVNKDAAKRAETYLNEIVSAGSYTMSTGIQLVRKSIAGFLAQDDGIEEPSLQHLFTTEGASQGVHMILSSLITCADDSIMIPIPQYPLYSAAITLYGGHASPYYLNEERGWQLDFEELERSINESRKAGKNVKAIVVINPGNPTGAIFNAETIKKIIEFSVKNKLVVIADEVYRQNIYKQGAQFFSFRNVLNKMPSQYKDQCELASLHSVSKGLLGECGLRGGYMYLHNFNPDIMQQIIKLKSINLCSNVIGQLMVELMVNPPLQGVSSQTTNLYLQERDVLFNSLKQRAQLVTSALRSMKNITCNEVEGAMYAFPQIKFSQKAVEAAGKQAPDLFYCLEVLKNIGIALVPGSGFRQQPGTHHFRITTLILP
jgi:alanine transaminase